MLFYSKYWFLPDVFNPLITVVGKPIQLPVIKNPTEDDILNYQKIYLESL